jgi:hypothetical protein
MWRRPGRAIFEKKPSTSQEPRFGVKTNVKRPSG